MSNKTYTRIADIMIGVIVVMGIFLALMSFYSFFFPSQQSLSYGIGFYYRLLWFALNIFMVTIAASVAVSLLLLATRKIRE